MASTDSKSEFRFYLPDTWPFWVASALYFFVITCGVLGWIFFSPPGTIFAQNGQDMIAAFVPWMTFFGAQLQNGNIPLWDPHVFCGTPYLANLNSACIYPFIWLSAIFPMDLFINLIVMVHFALAGWTTSLWCRNRGISGTGSVMAGTVYVFGGAFFLHLVSGHVQMICVLTYTPLILLSIDKLLDTGRPRWMLLGTVAVGLSIFTGFAQVIYYTGIVAVLYTIMRVLQELWALRSPNSATEATNSAVELNLNATVEAIALVQTDSSSSAPDSRRIVLPQIVVRAMMVSLIYIFGAALGAIQLLPTVQTSKDTIRAAGLTYEMASSCPEPPENFIILIAPNFWGATPGLNGEQVSYFGRWYPNEVMPFMGVGVVVLAVYGGLFGDWKLRRFSVTLVILCAVLSVGKHTPLYKLLYTYAPMYNSFRSANRWNLLMTLFIAMLSGVGLDAMLKRKRPPVTFAACLMIAAGVVYIGSLWLQHQAELGPRGSWAHVMDFLAKSDALVATPAERYADADFISHAALQASDSLVLPAGLLLLCGGILLAVRKFPVAAYLLAVMAVGEVCVFVWHNTPSSPYDIKPPAPWVNATSHLDSEDRVLSTSLGDANYGLVANYNDAFGYDPIVLTRYAEYLANLQIDRVPQMRDLLAKPINWVPPIVIQAVQTPDNKTAVVYSGRFWFLRIKHIFWMVSGRNPKGEVVQIPLDIGIPMTMPRASLIPYWKLAPKRDELFAEMNKPEFDPRNTMLLESEPDVVPDANIGADGNSTVRLTDLNTDRIEVSADLAGPRLLLITDSYAKDWRARSLDPDLPQKRYTVMPADHTFRAIPLQAGHHHFVLEYAPRSFEQGRAITLATSVIWLAIAGWPLRKRWPFVRAAPRRRVITPGVTASAVAANATPEPLAPYARSTRLPRAPATTPIPAPAPIDPQPAKPRPPAKVIPVPRFEGFHTPVRQRPRPVRKPPVDEPPIDDQTMPPVPPTGE